MGRFVGNSHSAHIPREYGRQILILHNTSCDGVLPVALQCRMPQALDMPPGTNLNMKPAHRGQTHPATALGATNSSCRPCRTRLCPSPSQPAPKRIAAVNSEARCSQEEATVKLLPGLAVLLTVLALMAEVGFALPGDEAHGSDQGHRRGLQTSRPYNIAHRGACGEFPEESAAAYQRAIVEGADFIETDITATKDGILICMHDLHLNDTTDVASHPEFLDRIATYEAEGETVTGWFAVDFSLEELKTLRLKQRFSFRDQSYNGQLQVITFEEYITIALNASRVVGIYPEIKSPVFINQHVKWPNGKSFEDVFVETLLKHGYEGAYLSKSWLAQPVFIQSFAPTSLVYLENITTSPKVFLIGDTASFTQDTNQSYAEVTSGKYLDYIKQYVVGIGPWKDTIVPPDSHNYLTTPSDLVEKAHKRGLQVHPYTFRNENSYLHFDFHQDPYQEYKYWLDVIGVDGLFTDFTGSLSNYQKCTTHSSDKSDAEKVLDKISSLIKKHRLRAGN